MKKIKSRRDIRRGYFRHNGRLPGPPPRTVRRLYGRPPQPPPQSGR